MRKIVAITVLLASSGLALADDSWQPKSWGSDNGTVKTVLAGWELIHFPDSEAGLLMIGKANKPVAVVTDYPDSVEIRAFVADSGDFVTLRDKDHDRRYEEIEGLDEGMIIKLDGDAYRLTKVGDTWSLSQLP